MRLQISKRNRFNSQIAAIVFAVEADPAVYTPNISVEQWNALLRDPAVFDENSLNNETLNALIAKVKDLNNKIAQDKSLGKGFCIGHSYFCGRTNCTEEWLHAVVDYDILPMIREYWFDETNKLQRWENILQDVFQS